MTRGGAGTCACHGPTRRDAWRSETTTRDQSQSAKRRDESRRGTHECVRHGLCLDDDLSQPLARQEKFHRIELAEKLFQTSIVEQLSRLTRALLPHLQRIHRLHTKR